MGKKDMGHEMTICDIESGEIVISVGDKRAVCNIFNKSYFVFKGPLTTSNDGASSCTNWVSVVMIHRAFLQQFSPKVGDFSMQILNNLGVSLP